MFRVVSTSVIAACLAIAQTPPESNVLQRALSFHQAGDYNGAIDAYQQYLQAHPDAPPEVRSNLGAALAHQGRFEEAIEQYNTALKAQPENSKLRLNLALAYVKSSQTRNAIDELSQVHAADPADEQASLLLAMCYQRLGEYRKVVEVLDPVAAAHPNDLGVAYLLGTALIRDNQVERGQRLVDQILRNGDSAEARLLLGTAKLQSRDFSGARDDLSRAVEIG